MTKLNRKYTAQFRVKVVLEMLKGEKTLNQICSHFGIHHSQACRWKNKALEGLEGVLSNGFKTEGKRKDELIEQLYKQIGQLKVEADFLKKKMGILAQNPF